MSATDGSNGERATVALVLAEVRGLRDLTDARFSDVQRQLDVTKNLPVAVQSLTERVLHSETRITELEKRDDKRQDWRKMVLPQVLIGLATVVIMIVAVVVSTHVA